MQLLSWYYLESHRHIKHHTLFWFSRWIIIFECNHAMTSLWLSRESDRCCKWYHIFCHPIPLSLTNCFGYENIIRISKLYRKWCLKIPWATSLPCQYQWAFYRIIWTWWGHFNHLGWSICRLWRECSLLRSSGRYIYYNRWSMNFLRKEKIYENYHYTQHSQQRQYTFHKKKLEEDFIP